MHTLTYLLLFVERETTFVNVFSSQLSISEMGMALTANGYTLRGSNSVSFSSAFLFSDGSIPKEE